MHSRRWILIIGIAAAVILAIVYGFMPRPVAVDISRASRGPMMVTVEEEGKTVVRDRFVLSAPISGYMRRISLEAGDPVRTGQKLAELEPLRPEVLDPRQYAAAEASVSAAEAAFKAADEKARAARADAEYAQNQSDRFIKLFETGYVSREDRDRAETDARRARAVLQSAEESASAARFELEKARTTLKYSADRAGNYSRTVPVPAPVNGRVLKIHHKSEGVVNSGEPLLDIGDPSRLEVRAEVLSSDAVKIGPGSAVHFVRWGGDQPLSGRVRVIEPAGFTKVSSLGVEEQRVLVISDITSIPESWQRLGDGYRVETKFVIWEGKDVLQVPASSLFRKGEGWAVFVVEGKKARLRDVGIGHRNGLSAEVLKGLSEGDEVIAHPDDSISDGVRVRPR